MNRFATLFAAAACCAFAAHAGMNTSAAHTGMATNAADATHITNGGTGYIGLTASAGTSDRMTAMADRAAPMRTATWASTSQEAGQVPMAQQAAPAPMALRTMGNASATGTGAAMDPRMNRAWGTPD